MRKIAVLIDGGFFIKRIKQLVEPRFCTTPSQVAETVRIMSKRHVQRLTGVRDDVQAYPPIHWLDYVYRIFYYDANPYDGSEQHPVQNQRIEFSRTRVAKFQHDLFNELRGKRKLAVRLGHVIKSGGWQIDPKLTRSLLRTIHWIDQIEDAMLLGNDQPTMSAEERDDLRSLVDAWRGVRHAGVNLGLRQKGVDMRISLDIASITLKRQADTIILVTGDSDFAPATRLARREGMEVILDPLWRNVSADLYEHVDGIVSVFPEPNAPKAAVGRKDG